MRAAAIYAGNADIVNADDGQDIRKILKMKP